MSEKNTTTAIDPNDPRYKGLERAEAGIRARNGEEVSVIERYPQVGEKILALMDQIPDAGEDGALGLIERLLDAESAEDFNSIWESEGLRDYLDEPIRVKAVKRAKSRKRGGMPYFLILTIVDPETGAEKVITTGAVAPVLTIGKLAARGALPIDLIAKEIPQEEGMEGAPINVKIIRTTKPGA